MKQIYSPDAPRAIGPYSQAIVVNGFVFCSGQVPLHPETGEMVGTTIQEQTEQSLKNLFAVLEAAGVGPDRVVKTTVLLSDMSNFADMNTVYERMFGDHKPARAAFAVKTLPKNALVEIEAVAAL